ncbi:hypothetical protein ACI797_22020 [Geodermatophilus sp. SYSU D00691]
MAAATGWALEPLGVLADPLGGVEAALVAHPGTVVAGVAIVACRLVDRSPRVASRLSETAWLR